MGMSGTLETNKSKFYWCKNLTATTWAEPIPLRGNVMPTNTDSEIEAYGAAFPQYLKYKDLAEVISQFGEKDRFYFRKVPPLVHNPLQNKKEDSNYATEGKPLYSLNVGELRIKYRAGQ